MERGCSAKLQLSPAAFPSLVACSPHVLAAVLASTLPKASCGVIVPAVLPTWADIVHHLLEVSVLVPLLTLVRFATLRFIAYASLDTSSMALTCRSFTAASSRIHLMAPSAKHLQLL